MPAADASPDGVAIRTATAADVDTVLAFWAGAASVPSSTDDPGALGALLRRDPGALLIAEADERIVGTTIVAWDGWRGAFYRLAVAPEVRRTGLARRLVETGERRLLELGARRSAVTVVTEHGHASAFWLAMGYEHDARMGRFVKDLG